MTDLLNVFTNWGCEEIKGERDAKIKNLEKQNKWLIHHCDTYRADFDALVGACNSKSVELYNLRNSLKTTNLILIGAIALCVLELCVIAVLYNELAIQ